MLFITLMSKNPLLDLVMHIVKRFLHEDFWSHDTFTNKQRILLMFISVWLLDLIYDMAAEKKKNCCATSMKIIQQKRWAASVVQMSTRSQRSGLKIIVDEEYLQSSKQTEMGQPNWELYSQTIYQPPSLSNISYKRLTHPSSPPKDKITISWLWREKK